MARSIIPSSIFGGSSEPSRKKNNSYLTSATNVPVSNFVVGSGVNSLTQGTVKIALNRDKSFTTSLLNYCDTIAQNTSAPMSGITTQSNLVINGNNCGTVEYKSFRDDVNVTSFTASDFYTATQNSNCSFLIFHKNLTIGAAVSFTPSASKLFNVIYVKGNLYLNGTLSMTGKGANHSPNAAGGVGIASTNIQIYSGNKSNIINGQVPKDGGAGGETPGKGNPGPVVQGVVGSSGANGGTGGGGGGGKSVFGDGGDGFIGSSFSGGPGGGGASDFNPGTQQKNYQNLTPGSPGSGQGGGGGSGHGSNGNFQVGGGNSGGGGGAGNPGGGGAFFWDVGTGRFGTPGGNGTGGVLIVVVLGQIIGSGLISANGVTGGPAFGSPPSSFSGGGGGGSGGGSITVICNSVSSTVTLQSNGGAGGNSNNPGRGGTGAAGGAGTARTVRLI